MTEHGRRIADGPVEPGPGRAGDGPTVLVAAVGVGWLLLTLVAMLRSTEPELGPINGAGQHLLVGLILAVAIAGIAAAWTNRARSTVAWVAVVMTSAALLLYELLQIPVPVRAFEWTDLTAGTTGATIGGVGAMFAMARRDRFVSTVALFGGVGLVLAAVAVAVVPENELGRTYDARLAECQGARDSSAMDWDLAVLALSDLGTGCVDTAAAPLVPFGARLGPTGGNTEAGGVNLDRGGLISAPLPGLADTIDGDDGITFGLRFVSSVVTDDTAPVVLGRLTVDGDPARPIAQLLQRGPHLTANIGSGRPVVGIGMSLADAARPEQPQELVVTYQSGRAVAYVDGRPVSEVSNDAFRFDLDGEVTLEVGWRADERWQPFEGTVTAVVVADRALTAAEVAAAFVGG